MGGLQQEGCLHRGLLDCGGPIRLHPQPLHDLAHVLDAGWLIRQARQAVGRDDLHLAWATTGVRGSHLMLLITYVCGS